jgi:hypothetical protein
LPHTKQLNQDYFQEFGLVGAFKGKGCVKANPYQAELRYYPIDTCKSMLSSPSRDLPMGIFQQLESPYYLQRRCLKIYDIIENASHLL